MGALRQGAQSYGGPRGPMASKGAHLLLIKGLISLKGAPAGDRVLTGAINTSKELSLLQEASYVYQENSLRWLLIVGQKISWSQGPSIALEKPIVCLKGPLIISWGPLSNNNIFR